MLTKQNTNLKLLKKGVITTTHFPLTKETTKSGIFQRLAMLISSLAESCERTIVIFIVAPTINEDKTQLERFLVLAREWLNLISNDIEFRIFGRDKKLKSDSSIIGRYFFGIFSFLRQPPYIDFSKKNGNIEKIYNDIVDLDPDVVIAFLMETAVPWLCIQRKPKKLIFDLNDVEHISLWRRMKKTPEWPSERLRLLHTLALAFGEYRISRFSNAVLVCSIRDEQYLNKIWRNNKAVYLPNAVKLRMNHRSQTLKNKENSIDAKNHKPIIYTFLGTYGYGPNVDAAVYLVEKIWPAIYKALPEAQLWIVGSAVDKLPARLSSQPGVKILGYVESLDMLYASTTVVCAPIRAGSGTRIKILEAAAYAKPIVSTTLGAEGIQLVDGKSVMIRDSAKSFADACIMLGTDSSACMQIGRAGYDIIAEYYNLNLIREKLKAIICT